MPNKNDAGYLAVDLETPDHLPACPSCGDLNPEGAILCRCGAELTLERGPRFVVVEIVGDLEPRVGRGRPGALGGLSCMVIDSRWNRKLMATFRSEDYGGQELSYANEQTALRAKATCRRKADELAADLNARAAEPRLRP